MNNLSLSDLKNNVIGIDEVGRGAWSGPVVACAVLLKKEILENSLIYQINDSKKVSKKTRNILDIFIRKNSFYSFGICDSKKIDSENIVNATKFAIIKAYKFFEHKKNIVKIDGPKFFSLNDRTQFIIKGDQKSITIASASILAKVFRDKIMTDLSLKYPFYGWEKNMGYGTKLHFQSIIDCGTTPFHRMTFSPMKSMKN